jgi:hypothetical protein
MRVRRGPVGTRRKGGGREEGAGARDAPVVPGVGRVNPGLGPTGDAQVLERDEDSAANGGAEHEDEHEKGSPRQPFLLACLPIALLAAVAALPVLFAGMIRAAVVFPP